jgi:hypothetical protein
MTDKWAVETAHERLAVLARSDGSGAVIAVAVDLDHTAGGVSVNLTRDQALSLAGWLALGAGYTLTPDPSGEGVRIRKGQGDHL